MVVELTTGRLRKTDSNFMGPLRFSTCCLLLTVKLTYTGFHGGLEHLNIETRLIDERFASLMGECVM